mmetsp:Transcript_21916/g.54204  ORF Transcript_21916/g.54204 Transcript_21916/m.54204 type:complete len:258 (+) Transcript_21916:193-966(+)
MDAMNTTRPANVSSPSATARHARSPPPGRTATEKQRHASTSVGGCRESKRVRAAACAKLVSSPRRSTPLGKHIMLARLPRAISRSLSGVSEDCRRVPSASGNRLEARKLVCSATAVISHSNSPASSLWHEGPGESPLCEGNPRPSASTRFRMRRITSARSRVETDSGAEGDADPSSWDGKCRVPSEGARGLLYSSGPIASLSANIPALHPIASLARPHPPGPHSNDSSPVPHTQRSSESHVHTLQHELRWSEYWGEC